MNVQNKMWFKHSYTNTIFVQYFFYTRNCSGSYWFVWFLMLKSSWLKSGLFLKADVLWIHLFKILNRNYFWLTLVSEKLFQRRSMLLTLKNFPGLMHVSSPKHSVKDSVSFFASKIWLTVNMWSSWWNNGCVFLLGVVTIIWLNYSFNNLFKVCFGRQSGGKV